MLFFYRLVSFSGSASDMEYITVLEHVPSLFIVRLLYSICIPRHCHNFISIGLFALFKVIFETLNVVSYITA